jgi:hypothetical protein
MPDPGPVCSRPGGRSVNQDGGFQTAPVGPVTPQLPTVQQQPTSPTPTAPAAPAPTAPATTPATPRPNGQGNGKGGE